MNNIDRYYAKIAPKVDDTRVAEVSNRVLRALGSREPTIRFSPSRLFESLRPVALASALTASVAAGVCAGLLIDVTPPATSLVVHAMAGGGM